MSSVWTAPDMTVLIEPTMNSTFSGESWRLCLQTPNVIQQSSLEKSLARPAQLPVRL